jgi:succinate dehydrogenase/fumarate reductase cytochrome b subunit
MRETKFWTWHLLAGCAILILGGLHMITIHLDGLLGFFNPAGASAIDWANVAARSRQTIFAIVYILLLGVTLFHGFYGLRNILLELGIGKGGRAFVNTVLVIGGLALFAFGTWAAIVAQAV